ncbi:MAG TPA: serine/threonine-protein kinase [Kofleriaceae bacterium]|nr:serine/threonine-protein kinase [Kofleriaceae bacterium]
MEALAQGTTVDRYRIEDVLGAGSMGDVFRGLDVDLNRPVALKILSERHRDNKELRARFVREARAVAAISHPNVVQVFTTGTHDDRPYIAMELLRGTDLGTAVKDHGPWPSLQVARAILDAARGLDAAAKAGLIHRDVKPSNLVLVDTGVVKVTDFGLAKPVDPASEPALTAMGVVVGTPDYIAPEQARGDHIDERVDIYALGGTTYFLLTGKPPFRTGVRGEDKYLKVVARHLRNPAPDARAVNPEIDRELAALARQMMEKRPADRPDYAGLIDDLSTIVDRLQGGAGPSPRPSTDRSGVRRIYGAEPTPYVGGNVRLPSDLRDPADSSSDTTRKPTTDPDAALVRRPRTSRLLIAVTLVAIAVFFSGLTLVLWGPGQ